ncbi:MAG: hypothetical protein COW67_01195 [Flavobacteriales bacterium CG18_big_fil_WC_8_21_14_2_50_32_9]|nr:MAG: hypothetical protein COW67_01195 [Flavobacteriales bacterium CG18_big_fil_WC_8_21_14_2_50_32_9]
MNFNIKTPYYLLLILIFVSCRNESQNNNSELYKHQELIDQKNRELELKEKELLLKESELALLKSELNNKKTKKKSLNTLYEEVKKSVYLIYTKSNNSFGQGSAFVVSPDGIAISNFHVFKNASEAIAINEEGQEFMITEIIETNQDEDYIIFKIGPIKSPLSYLKISGDVAKIGDDCFTVGNPEGLTQTISKGLISSYRDNNRLIQTTTEITHGSSGGPLLNLEGNVIGITTSGLNKANLNFAVNIKSLYLDKYINQEKILPKDNYIPEKKLKLLISNYYNALSNDDFSVLNQLYASNLNRYYNKFDVPIIDAINLAKSYKEKYGIINLRHTVDWNTLKINKINDVYILEFKMDYETLRENKDKPSKFKLSIIIEVNSDLKIQSIYEYIISKK